MWEKIHVSGKRPQPRSESIAIAVSELHLQGDPCATPLGGPRGRSRPTRCSTTEKTTRHSSYLPNNKVTPCEKTYVFKASNQNYVDGSPSQTNESAKLISPAAQNTTGGILKEISKLSQINISRLGHNKCSYTVLTSSNDSTESLVYQSQPNKPADYDWTTTESKNSMVKSQSAHVINKRRVTTNALVSPVIPEVGSFQPKPYINRHQASINEWRRKEMTREPISVPNFSDLTLPTPVLTPVEAARLVFLDSEEEEGYNNDVFDPPADDHDIVQVLPAPTPCDFAIIHKTFQTNVRDDSYNSHLGSCATDNHIYENLPKQCTIIPKSTSVRFQNYPDLEEASDENSTSDYASIEAVNKISSNSTYSMSTRHSFTPQDENDLGMQVFKSNMKHSDTAFGFCNPNYMGPDIQTILSNNAKQTLYQDSSVNTNTQIAKILNTPDSGITDSRSDSRQLFLMEDMVEMTEFSNSSTSTKKESKTISHASGESRLPPRSLTIESPCSPYQSKDLAYKPRAKSSSRAERQRNKSAPVDEEAHDMSCFTSDIVIPLYVYVIGGKEQGQVAVFKRPLSVWKYKLF